MPWIISWIYFDPYRVTFCIRYSTFYKECFGHYSRLVNNTFMMSHLRFNDEYRKRRGGWNMNRCIYIGCMAGLRSLMCQPHGDGSTSIKKSLSSISAAPGASSLLFRREGGIHYPHQWWIRDEKEYRYTFFSLYHIPRNSFCCYCGVLINHLWRTTTRRKRTGPAGCQLCLHPRFIRFFTLVFLFPQWGYTIFQPRRVLDGKFFPSRNVCYVTDEPQEISFFILSVPQTLFFFSLLLWWMTDG